MFRIGEFSHIAQVSGRLLRYYDEIGLLSPEYADPQTGYRYYSAKQLPRLNRILLLRKAQITQAMQDGMVQLQLVEARLDQVDAFGQTPVLDVVVKAASPQR